ncbi:hypothetical protein ACH5RR_030103 [Cinchona calisaya]|uniref:Uncharacterized protein n=1 Tax=Cinchona calisaya TaxID=153742 RepID=A0ABD2YTN9_9GENT
MDILPFEYLDGFKRYWRRRKYQRLDDAIKMKRKLKIARLGSKRSGSGKQKELIKTKKVDKFGGFKFITPMKLLAKFHEAYIDAMIRLSGSKRIDHVNNEAKRVAKCKPIPMLSASTNEMVDSRVVVEIYKRVVSTRDQPSIIVPEL